jgi:WD40 repeat protein
VYRLIVLQNGDLVSGSGDTTIKIWDVDRGTVKSTLIGNTKNVFVLKLLANGDLASGSGDGAIKIWNVENGTVKKDMNINNKFSRVNSLEELKSGELVSGSDTSILIWE